MFKNRLLRRVFSSTASSRLTEPSLLRSQCYINGEWCDADSQATFQVTNPSTLTELGTIPNMGANETKRAILAAKEAFPDWSGRTVKERAGILRKWHDLLLKYQTDLATLITLEQGAPITFITLITLITLLIL